MLITLQLFLGSTHPVVFVIFKPYEGLLFESLFNEGLINEGLFNKGLSYQ